MREQLRKFPKGAWLRRFLALEGPRPAARRNHEERTIPDIAGPRTQGSVRKPVALVGVRWDLDQQLEWLRRICRPYYAEVQGRGLDRAILPGDAEPGHGPIEDQVLYCFIRAAGPRTIVEIDGGVTSALMAEASKMNAGEGGRPAALVFLEPSMQEAAPSVFDELDAGDLLVVDSTQAAKAGFDVPRIYLEVIPRLKPGVFIHVHDVYLPYLCPPGLSQGPNGWQETALVLALLVNNRSLSVLCCESALHYGRPAQLRQVLPDYDADVPSSLWLKTVRA